MPGLEDLTEEQRKLVETAVADKIKAEGDKLVDAKLKDLGYDEHAIKAIEKRNKEAQKHREAAEAEKRRADELAAKLKEHEDAVAARKAEEDQRLKEAEEAKRKAEDAKKSVDERIENLSKAFDEKLDKELSRRDKKAAEEQEKLLQELSKRDRRILMETVRAEATKEGILDDELVALLDLKDVSIEDGVPDREKVREIVLEHKTSKPHFYKDGKKNNDDDDAGSGGDDAVRTRDERGRFAAETERRPDPNKGKSPKVDWGSLSPEEFARREAEWRRSLRS